MVLEQLYLSQRNKKLCSHKNLYKNVHSKNEMFTAALFLKAKNWKLKYPLYPLMVKQTVVHLYHRVLLSNKEERTIDTCNLNKFQKNYAEFLKKANLQRLYNARFHLYNIVEMTKL